MQVFSEGGSTFFAWQSKEGLFGRVVVPEKFVHEYLAPKIAAGSIYHSHSPSMALPNVTTATGYDTYQWTGSDVTDAKVSGTWNVGEKGEITPSVGVSRVSMEGSGNETSVIGGVKGTYYMGEYGKIDTTISLDPANQKKVGVQYDFPIPSTSMYATLEADHTWGGLMPLDNRISLDVHVPLGNSHPAVRFDRPSDDTLPSVGVDLSEQATDFRSSGIYGKVEKTGHVDTAANILAPGSLSLTG